MTEALPSSPVPLVILTGFLGAGKTTVLNRVLAAQHHRRIAVLVNELGRIDIDAGLIRARAGDVLELSGGCVCHQIGVQRELWSALHDVARRARPDLVILETTGIAEPDAILEGLEALRLAAHDAGGEIGGGDADDHEPDDEDDVGIAQRGRGSARRRARPAEPPPVRVSAVVTVVDAEAGARQLERHDEARAQVRSADRILLSKLDLMTDLMTDSTTDLTAASSAAAERGAPALAALHRRLHDLNPAAERAAFPDGPGGTASLIPWLLASAPRRQASNATGAGGRRAVPHGEHAHQLAAASYVDDAPLVADGLLLVCASLGDRLVRAKGHVYLAGEPRRAFLDRAGDRTRLDLGAPWGDEPPMTRLVLIGEDLDEAALQRQLWACRAAGLRDRG